MFVDTGDIDVGNLRKFTDCQCLLASARELNLIMNTIDLKDWNAPCISSLWVKRELGSPNGEAFRQKIQQRNRIVRCLRYIDKLASQNLDHLAATLIYEHQNAANKRIGPLRSLSQLNASILRLRHAIKRDP